MTRAVLLNRSGAVHRVIVGPDGAAEMTACGETYQRYRDVSPLQAMVFSLPECHGGLCWPLGAWHHFIDGSVV